MNWMLSSVPDYAELEEPLRRHVMEAIFVRRNSRRSNGLEKIKLSDHGWNDRHVTLLAQGIGSQDLQADNAQLSLP